MLTKEDKIALRVVFGAHISLIRSLADMAGVGLGDVSVALEGGDYITADDLIQETMNTIGLDSVTVTVTGAD